VGAREYDTSTGRFLSVDPIMDLTDPQQINGYASPSGADGMGDLSVMVVGRPVAARGISGASNSYSWPVSS
jgi:hypothetical protein